MAIFEAKIPTHIAWEFFIGHRKSIHQNFLSYVVSFIGNDFVVGATPIVV